MSPIKRRRRYPTVIDRGLGLLEVILPRGASESGESFLPPGQRDTSGFWYPAGYDKPGDIFSPLQRELQENQRRIQKRRLQTNPRPPLPAGGDGTMTVHGSSGGAHSPPPERPQSRTSDPPSSRAQVQAPGSSDTRMPLPPPLPEASLPHPDASSPIPHTAPRRPPLAAPRRFSDPEAPLLPNADVPMPRARAAGGSPARAEAARVVDSREASD